jgi:hypothetical protein
MRKPPARGLAPRFLDPEFRWLEDIEQDLMLIDGAPRPVQLALVCFTRDKRVSETVTAGFNTEEWRFSVVCYYAGVLDVRPMAHHCEWASPAFNESSGSVSDIVQASAHTEEAASMLAGLRQAHALLHKASDDFPEERGRA